MTPVRVPANGQIARPSRWHHRLPLSGMTQRAGMPGGHCGRGLLIQVVPPNSVRLPMLQGISELVVSE